MTMVAKYELLRNQGASAETIHAVVRADAIRLAGGPDDMVQRALVYHYVYKLSGDAFVFPLIAAHGALWARWYLIAARFDACILGAVDISYRGSRARRLATYGIYVDTLKSINQPDTGCSPMRTYF